MTRRRPSAEAARAAMACAAVAAALAGAVGGGAALAQPAAGGAGGPAARDDAAPPQPPTQASAAQPATAQPPAPASAAPPATAQPAPPPPPPPAPAATGRDGAKAWASCAEHVPTGATRPRIQETFPRNGFSGYAAPLEVTVAHGKGETVLPEGFKVQGDSDAARALEQAGFVLPEADAGAGPTSTTTATDSGATTTLVIPFVPLPKEPGRNVLVLPPVPIAVSRASGELVTVCTRPHEIVVEDPIANERDPRVKPNPPPRPQREEWVLAKQLTAGVLLGAALGLLLAWLVRRWLRRPRVAPAPPPKLPWVAALEELEALRRSSLLSEGRTDEYFDRVSDCVRNYLGARYGFDGLETTSDEMRALLARVRPPVPVLPQIDRFLADCDLVKFARLQPGEADCLDALERGEIIVHRTTPPAARPAQGAAGPGGAGAGGAPTAPEAPRGRPSRAPEEAP
ncbi:hypothetical protein WMF31_08070 [Sorangium sp. So ce1036]|uniref:hypothetical protein n=1 Tax=Sorangium sp. So ce1036 TaxID=3133328 RepID=UPI003F01CC0E